MRQRGDVQPAARRRRRLRNAAHIAGAVLQGLELAVRVIAAAGFILAVLGQEVVHVVWVSR